MNIKKNTLLMHLEGFTLAEVLITLVIIGVIAAMTIPTLMKNTQNQELVTGLKKAHSTLSQALINMAKNNDSTPGDYSFLNNSNFIDEFAKVTNFVKKCTSNTDCFNSNLRTDGKYKYLNGGNTEITEGKSIITADGQILTFATSFGASFGLSAEDNTNCVGRIAIDVNGHKGPNITGRDLFLFYVINGKGIVPAGAENTSTCSKTSSGIGCTAKVIRENAMNY